jgi:hypothetical protein
MQRAEIRQGKKRRESAAYFKYASRFLTPYDQRAANDSVSPIKKPAAPVSLSKPINSVAIKPVC